MTNGEEYMRIHYLRLNQRLFFLSTSSECFMVFQKTSVPKRRSSTSFWSWTWARSLRGWERKLLEIQGWVPYINHFNYIF